MQKRGVKAVLTGKEANCPHFLMKLLMLLGVLYSAVHLSLDFMCI